MGNKFKNIIWYSGDKYIMVIMSFITTVILSRTLSPNILGEVVLLQTFVIFFSVVTLLSLDPVFIKKISESERYVAMVFFMKTMASLFSMILYFIYAIYIDGSLDITSKLMLGLPLLLSFTNTIDLILMAKKEIYKVASKTFILYFAIGLIKCALLFFITDVKFICFLLVIEQLVARAFVLIYGIKTKLVSLGFIKISKQRISDGISLFNEGKYLILSSFFLIGFVRTNQMMVDDFLGSESLAYYSMPIKIVDGFTILITTYVSAIYPYLLSSIKESGKSKAAEIYFGSIVKGGLLITLLLYFNADKIILTIFGEQYIESVSVLKIYSIALFFNGLFISSGRWFIALSQQNFVAWRNFIAFSLNVLMSYILIPRYGIDGAAISALVSWSIAGYLSFIISNENRWLMIAIPKSFFKFNKPL